MQLSTAHKQRVARALRLVTAGALMASSLGTALATQVHAGVLNSNITTIADSRVSQSNVSYTLDFTTPTSSTTAIKQVNVEFCTAADDFTASCTAPTGHDISIAGATASGFAGSAGATTGTFTRDSANQFHFVVTTPASETNIKHEMILTTVTNSSAAGVYYVRLRTYSDTGTTALDDGTSAYAIVAKVTVSGRVLESMTFTVTSVGNATQCGTGADTSTAGSTATTIPFGNFVSGTPRIACQKVKTATNALSGYLTTVKETGGGSSPVGGMCRQTSANCTADGGTSGVSASDVIVDAVLNSTPASWTNGTTFGLGLNANGAEAHSQFGGATNYRGIFGATPINIATTTGPTTGTDTYVVYKADVNSAQTAGVYQNSVEYVTTPTF